MEKTVNITQRIHSAPTRSKPLKLLAYRTHTLYAPTGNAAPPFETTSSRRSAVADTAVRSTPAPAAVHVVPSSIRTSVRAASYPIPASVTWAEASVLDSVVGVSDVVEAKHR